MRIASSGLLGLLILVNDAVQVVQAQNVPPQGWVIRMREGSLRGEPMVSEINQKMNSHPRRRRRIKGDKEEKNEDEGAKEKGKGKPADEEILPKEEIKGDDKPEEKDEKLPKGGNKLEKLAKEGIKGAKKEKVKTAKEEMKESDKVVKGISTIPPMAEDSEVPAAAPSDTEETTSPAPSFSPTCVECDDLGR